MQPIDHFDYTSDASFIQRYFVFDDHFQHDGPAILYICGEGECRGISNTSWVAQIAQKINAMVFSLEHRFYGKSLPFGEDSMSWENLKYLNSEQALSDLAFFINQISVNQRHGMK